MRAPVTVGMSGLTGLVLVVSWYGSLGTPVRRTATAPGPVGVVQTPQVAARPRPHPRPRVSALPRSAAPSPAASPRTAVRRPSPAPHPVVVSPRPVRTTPPPPQDVTVNGAPADTQYGPVQVQITVHDGQIVQADAIDYPQGSSRDRSINSQAIPQLDDETLQAQSAQIDTVSGATYTSEGYRESLQSALDAAHRAGAL